MPRTRILCLRCGHHFPDAEVGVFRILNCPGCVQVYRLEVSGGLTPCDSNGRPLVTESAAVDTIESAPDYHEDEPAADRNGVIVGRWKAGASPYALGKLYNLSTARINHIVGRALMREYRENEGSG